MNTKRSGHRILSDGRKIARFICKDCARSWVANHSPIVNNDSHEVVKESLERASVRILSRRYGIGTKQINNAIHRITDGVKDSIWIAKHFPLNWSGTLIFDGKVVRVYDKLSKQLKEKLSEQELMWMNKKTWLCGIDYGTGDLPHYDLAEDESKIDLVMYFRALKKIICAVQRIIEADDLETAGKYLEHLKQINRRTKTENELVDLFKKYAQKLTAHLLHPELNIPHTSNDIENLFRQLNLRLKTIGRFYRWQYARDYLKAWALLRRFTKFTDCRNGRRWRNGKAPIQIAGANITGIDYLKL